MSLEHINEIGMKEFTNGAGSAFSEYWEYLLEKFVIPLYHYIYICSIFNAIKITIKYVSMGFYVYAFIRYRYKTSRERIKQKQTELEDIKLQLQVVETKLSLRESEGLEREQLLKRKVEEFWTVRARIKETVKANEELHRAIGTSTWDEESNFNINNASEEESKLILELLKELKYDQTLELETGNWREKINCDQEFAEPACLGNSEYRSANEAKGKQDYHIKIVKVTKVYKVAYLRHCIRQNRMRRANKQAMLRKKMDSIKKLLDDWHTTLNMVINSKLSFLNFDTQHMEIASQEAMGDYSKSNNYNCSDSDSDFRNSADNCHDDYSMSWTQNQFRPIYNYDDFTDATVAREFCDVEECCNIYNNHEAKCDCSKSTGVLFIVPEETKSQVEIEEIKSDKD